MDSLTRRTAGCGPACPVVWQGRAGDRSPYADSKRLTLGRVHHSLNAGGESQTIGVFARNTRSQA